MPMRSRLLQPARLLVPVALAAALVSGCTAGASPSRTPGDHVTDTEAQALAQLLHRDEQGGGADFTESVNFAEGATLTLTGTVDFVHKTGRADAVTTYATTQPTDKRTIFFTAKDLWYGDVPGLSAALTSAGLPPATYVRRPLAVVDKNGQPSLVDVLVQLVLNLSSTKDDDPKSFTSGDYTWQGQRTVDGRFASVYRLKGGATVALGVKDKELLQYVAPLPGGSSTVTITLPQHGQRSIELPSDAQTLDATAHPDVAGQVGV